MRISGKLLFTIAGPWHGWKSIIRFNDKLGLQKLSNKPPDLLIINPMEEILAIRSHSLHQEKVALGSNTPLLISA